MEFAAAQNPSADSTAKPGVINNGANLEFTCHSSGAALAAGVTFTVEWRATAPPAHGP